MHSISDMGTGVHGVVPALVITPSYASECIGEWENIFGVRVEDIDGHGDVNVNLALKR